MSDISGGAPKFPNRDELEAWLKTQPREVSIVIAARAALRVAPLVGLAERLEPRQFTELTFATFRANALAWVAARYPTRAHELRELAASIASPADDVPAPSSFRAAAHAAHAARATVASGSAALAADYVSAAGAAVVRAATAATYAYSLAGVRIDEVTLADATWLRTATPDELASEPLWPQVAPDWAQHYWLRLKNALDEPHWKPWLDWYQRRLDGDEDPEDIEFLFATLPTDPREKDPAEQNKELAAAIEERRSANRASEMEATGGQVNFKNHAELRAWLKTQPREVSVVIATRAALRVLPIIPERISNMGEQNIRRVIFAGFWGAALARLAAKSMANDKDLLEIAARYHYVLTATNTSVRNAVGAIRNPDYDSLAAHAVDEAADDAAAYAKALAPTAYADQWQAASSDANRLRSAAPSTLAREPLWPQGEPDWAHNAWRDLRQTLSELHWIPWLDWYQWRRNGREESEAIELLFAKLPIDPRDKDPAEQNAALAAAIDKLRGASTAPTTGIMPPYQLGYVEPPQVPQSWDFFISYSTKDEDDAREIASVLEDAGHSTFAQYKDIAPGNNFVREMQRGLDGMGRMIALYSEEYQASEMCQAEWAAAFKIDPSGRKRKLIPLLLRPTALNALAQPVVYKSLVGLTGDARRQAILDAVKEKPAAPLSLTEIERRLEELATPKLILNDAGQVDIAPNERVDRARADTSLQELVSTLRTLIRLLKANLPGNTSKTVRDCLKAYDAELTARGAQPYTRTLKDLAAALQKAFGPDSEEMQSGEVASLVGSFFTRHAELLSHFSQEPENLNLEIKIDESAAAGPAVSKPIDKLAEKVAEAKEAKLVSDEANRFVQDSAKFARDIASASSESASGDAGRSWVSFKKRYIAGALAFMLGAYSFLGNTVTILGTPQGQAVYEALREAINAFKGFLMN